MILVDTSIWIDYLRTGDEHLEAVLQQNWVLSHPFVVGELACGNLGQRKAVLGYLHSLPEAPVVSGAEALSFLEQRALMGRGIGYIDVHLLASAILGTPALLWTRDRRLNAVAFELDIGYAETRS